MRLFATILVLSALAGCFWGVTPHAAPTSETYEPDTGLFVAELDSGRYHAVVAWAPGAISTITNTGDSAMMVQLPDDFLLIRDNRFQHATVLDDALLESGDNWTFLPPPSTTSYTLFMQDTNFDIAIVDDIVSWNQIVSGELAYALSAHQEETFPNRTPGTENYGKSIDYFAGYFADLGYDVEVDPYGTQDATDVTGCAPIAGICPETFANVVATKVGSNPDKAIFVSGAHFDMVPETTHAAFDDTSGVVTTLALAKALAPYEFEYTLKFALWGGEEDGILGSQFWVQSNPDAKASVVSYWNLDVVGMSWPVPLIRPDPIVIAAGPDIPAGEGDTSDPISQDLLNWAQYLQRDVMGYPDNTMDVDNNTYPAFIYEGVASGQIDGYAGVNAQSDHTPFIAAGIPSYFIFNGDTLAISNPKLHTESDTLDNMTKYALLEESFAGDTVLTPEQQLTAEAALAQSWEAVMFFPLYHTLFVDMGDYTPPAVGGFTP